MHGGSRLRYHYKFLKLSIRVEVSGCDKIYPLVRFSLGNEALTDAYFTTQRVKFTTFLGF